MKKLSTIITVFCVIFSFAQKVSDYKYITLPERFSGFREDQYHMDAVLTKTLMAKKYIIVSENSNKWPAKADSNPCSILKVDVLDDSGFLRNKVILEFKDCNNKVIASQKGSSSIKSFEEGFQDALKQALINVPVSYPKTIQSLAVQEQQQIPTQNEQTDISENKAEKFSNGKANLQKIQIDSNQFILVEGNSSVPFATFKSTTKKDVYRVKLSSGDSTIGYFENGNLIIEIPQNNGEYSKEIFSSK